MASEPWKSKDWFVSAWDYASEVNKDFTFAKNIKIHDVTLRDGEQQAGIVFTKDDKIRIAEALAEAGVHRIEAGMPVVSPADNEAIKEIVKRNLGPQIFSFARCMKEDVKRAIDTGVTGVVMEIPSSQHIIDIAYRWPMEKAIETSIEFDRLRSRKRSGGRVLPDRFHPCRFELGPPDDQSGRHGRPYGCAGPGRYFRRHLAPCRSLFRAGGEVED